MKTPSRTWPLSDLSEYRNAAKAAVKVAALQVLILAEADTLEVGQAHVLRAA